MHKKSKKWRYVFLIILLFLAGPIIAWITKMDFFIKYQSIALRREVMIPSSILVSAVLYLVVFLIYCLVNKKKEK